MRDHILERLDERDREFEVELRRMTIRKLETVRLTWALGIKRLELWRGEVGRRVEAGRVVSYQGGLRAGPKAEGWECEPAGLSRVFPSGVKANEEETEAGLVLVLSRNGAEALRLNAEDAEVLRDVLGGFLAMKPV
jgi:hypothetical protein